MDVLVKNNIKSLMLKGFSKEEVAKLLNIDLKDIQIDEEEIVDMNTNSIDYYSELQKDLAKLVYSELNKETRDSNVILTAIKLQANLQEKKTMIGRRSGGTSKISSDYIYERDKEVAILKEKGSSDEEIGKELDMHVLSVRQAADRNSLNLSDAWKERLSPSVISETKGLDMARRMKLLQQAYDEDLKRNDVREITNKIKNEGR